VVYKGYNQLYRPVLIKQLLPQHVHDEARVAQFKNEFHFHVNHPNIIASIDCFECNGNWYLVREWIDGTPLHHTINKLKPEVIQHICASVLQALAHLHQHHIFHLDVQPKNIIIGNNGTVYLSDLGLAIHAHSPRQRQPFNIYYCSPEQMLNQVQLIQANTDLYAVGMMLYEMVAKTKPHQHQNPEVLMNLILAAPLQNTHGLSKALFAIINKATSKPRFNLPPTHYSQQQLVGLLEAAQNNRYAHATDFLNALKQLSLSDFKRKAWWKLW
jgi:serine/threonine protein kinase